MGWILPLLLSVLGCSSTMGRVEHCKMPRDNPYVLKDNPYHEDLEDNPTPETTPTCEEACLPSFTGCVQECTLGGGLEDTCLTECARTDECLGQCSVPQNSP